MGLSHHAIGTSFDNASRSISRPETLSLRSRRAPSAELPNAVAAVARELAGFLWAVMQDESAAQRH